jgi:hypothetical protein
MLHRLSTDEMARPRAGGALARGVLLERSTGGNVELGSVVRVLRARPRYQNIPVGASGHVVYLEMDKALVEIAGEVYEFLVDDLKEGRFPLCPVCGGQKRIPSRGISRLLPGKQFVTCHRCSGEGIVRDMERDYS